MHIHGGDIYSNPVRLDFSSNLNFLGMPEAVKQAACEGVQASGHYPDPWCRELRAAIAKKEQLPAEQIICGNGAAELIFTLAAACKPSKALLLAPSFYEYEQALRAVDCEILYETLTAENEFACTEHILETITAAVDILFLCNPNNPTGQPIPPALMEQILSRCRETGTRLIVDECFLEFLDDGEARSVKPRLAAHPNVFILKAFTKIYAMPGLRLGYGLTTDKALLTRMREVSQPWSVSIPAQKAGIAALKEKAYVQRYLSLLKQERAYLKQELPTLGLRLYGSEANYIFFQGPTGLQEACEAQGILIRDCSNYQGLTPGYYRIAVRSHEENKELLTTLKKLL